MRRPLTITSKMTLVFVLFAAALLAGVGSLAYNSGRTALQAAITSNLFSIAIEKQAAIDRWVIEAKSHIAAIAASEHLQEDVASLMAAPNYTKTGVFHDHLLTDLKLWTGEDKHFQNFLLIEPESGRVVAATDLNKEGKFVEDRLYFINGKKAPYVQNPYYDLTTQTPTMTASAPIVSADGQLLAVLAGHLNIDELDGIITRRTGLTKTDDAYIVNTSHLFVTQPRFVTDPAILKRGINTEGVNLGLAGNSGVISATDYRGVPVITVYRWLPKRQLCLIVEIDQEEAFATPRVFGKTIIIIAGFVLLLASLIAFVVARTINRPILVLKDGAVRFGKGDLNFRLPVSSEDEIGLLTKEFNIMAVNLTEKESKLHAYAGQLEQMVESRTAKLKLSEESLRESEQKFRSLIEDAPEAIFVHADARFIYLNPAAVGLFGAKEADQLIGSPITERFDPDYHEMIQERMRLLYEEHKKLPAIEQIYLRLDGSSVPVEVQAVPINYDNQSAALTFVRDITRRKAAEAALQASIDEVRTISQQLWQAAKLATMGELASSIAHELNNPLATVSLRIESLTAQTSADNVRRRELEIIGQEVERMGNLVTNLLQFSRRSQKQVSTLDTREEIEKTLELIHYHLRKNNIQVIREFAPEVPGILADRQQLRQLFLNLFTNAGDAMPKGGTLTIRVYAQGSGGRDQGSGVRSSPDPRFPTPFVVIEIVDTGTGIPPEILPKVMEPFYTTKPEGRGTGLGLAICRRIAQEHGGSFDITSEGIPGTGTKVRITLQSLDQGNSIGLLDP